MPPLIARIGSRALRAAGLERSGRASELREALARAEQRVVDLKKLLEHTRQEAQASKAKLHEASKHYEQQRQAERAAYQARLAKAEERSEKASARLGERDVARHEKVGELREKVIAADRSVRIGRDHLMAIEVKLDVVEGAVNVLDRRFRMVGRLLEQGAKRNL
jgi:chromosome segregation ATPase